MNIGKIFFNSQIPFRGKDDGDDKKPEGKKSEDEKVLEDGAECLSNQNRTKILSFKPKPAPEQKPETVEQKCELMIDFCEKKLNTLKSSSESPEVIEMISEDYEKMIETCEVLKDLDDKYLKYVQYKDLMLFVSGKDVKNTAKNVQILNSLPEKYMTKFSSPLVTSYLYAENLQEGFERTENIEPAILERMNKYALADIILGTSNYSPENIDFMLRTMRNATPDNIQDILNAPEGSYIEISDDDSKKTPLLYFPKKSPEDEDKKS